MASQGKSFSLIPKDDVVTRKRGLVIQDGQDERQGYKYMFSGERPQL